MEVEVSIIGNSPKNEGMDRVESEEPLGKRDDCTIICVTDEVGDMAMGPTGDEKEITDVTIVEAVEPSKIVQTEEKHQEGTKYPVATHIDTELEVACSKDIRLEEVVNEEMTATNTNQNHSEKDTTPDAIPSATQYSPRTSVTSQELEKSEHHKDSVGDLEIIFDSSESSKPFSSVITPDSGKRKQSQDSTGDLEILFDASTISKRSKFSESSTLEVPDFRTRREYQCAVYPEVIKISKPFQSSILKGCKWSPDGSCLLTNCEDNVLRLFDLPRAFYTNSWKCHDPSPDDFDEPQVSLRAREGGLVYDYTWYPTMSSDNPLSCYFLTTSAGCPIHLWDAYKGRIEASYRIHNYADELVSALCLSFDCSGDKIFSGYRCQVRIFQTSIPGRDSIVINVKEKAKLNGLISCITPNPQMRQLFAIGTYRRAIGLFTEDGVHVCSLLGHRGGITQLKFSDDGSRLYSGGRMDNEILCWDLRKPGTVLCSMPRTVSTNQRIYFDLTPTNEFLLSGNTDGNLSIWELGPLSNDSVEMELKPSIQFQAHADCTNGCSVNPKFSLLATCSGMRRPLPSTIDLTGAASSGEEEEVIEIEDKRGAGNLSCQKYTGKQHNKNGMETCVKFWWMGGHQRAVLS